MLLDGSYTYGYEAADGSFKIETKAATGEVKGKNAANKFNKNDTYIPCCLFKENTDTLMVNALGLWNMEQISMASNLLETE